MDYYYYFVVAVVAAAVIVVVLFDFFSPLSLSPLSPPQRPPPPHLGPHSHLSVRMQIVVVGGYIVALWSHHVEIVQTFDTNYTM